MIYLGFNLSDKKGMVLYYLATQQKRCILEIKFLDSRFLKSIEKLPCQNDSIYSFIF